VKADSRSPLFVLSLPLHLVSAVSASVSVVCARVRVRTRACLYVCKVSSESVVTNRVRPHSSTQGITHTDLRLSTFTQNLCVCIAMCVRVETHVCMRVRTYAPARACCGLCGNDTQSGEEGRWERRIA